MDKTVLERDLTFFIISFSLAFVAILLNHFSHIILGIVMVILYFVYLYKTIKEESLQEYKGEELEENLDPFFLSKFTSLQPTTFLILVQLFVSLFFLVFSAHYFVEVIKKVSGLFNFSPFVISLLLAPIATELPEKFNSWMWIRQKKDTLAIGNISGALVFQSTFPVTIGLLFTTWEISTLISYLTFIFCLINAMIVLFALKKNKLTYKTFLLCGVLYVVYLFLVLMQNK